LNSKNRILIAKNASILKNLKVSCCTIYFKGIATHEAILSFNLCFLVE